MALVARIGRLVREILIPLRYSGEVDGWVGLFPQVLVVGALIASAINILLGPLAWVFYGLSLSLVLTLTAAYRYQARIDRFEERPQPRLVFDKPEVRKVWIGPIQASGSGGAVNAAIELIGGIPHLSLEQTIHLKGEVLVGIAKVANDPEKNVLEAQLSEVVIAITFFAAGGRVAVELFGRWTENEQPGTRPQLKPIDDIRRRNLIPNGEPNHIDVALKYEDDDCCYAFNDDTCRFVTDWRDPSYRLSDSEYRVRIALKGVGLAEKQEYWLLLRNKGVGKGMELEPSTPLASPGASGDPVLTPSPSPESAPDTEAPRPRP